MLLRSYCAWSVGFNSALMGEVIWAYLVARSCTVKIFIILMDLGNLSKAKMDKQRTVSSHVCSPYFGGGGSFGEKFFVFKNTLIILREISQFIVHSNQKGFWRLRKEKKGSWGHRIYTPYIRETHSLVWSFIGSDNWNLPNLEVSNNPTRDCFPTQNEKIYMCHRGH